MLIKPSAVAVLLATVLSSTRSEAQSCKTYDFRLPEGAAGRAAADAVSEVAGDFMAWAGGSSAACEGLRGRIEGALERRVRDAGENAQKASQLLTTAHFNMYDFKISSEEKQRNLDAASAASERASSNLSAAKSALSLFPRRCTCIDQASAPITPSPNNQAVRDAEAREKRATEEAAKATSPKERDRLTQEAQRAKQDAQRAKQDAQRIQQSSSVAESGLSPAELARRAAIAQAIEDARQQERAWVRLSQQRTADAQRQRALEAAQASAALKSTVEPFGDKSKPLPAATARNAELVNPFPGTPSKASTTANQSTATELVDAFGPSPSPANGSSNTDDKLKRSDPYKPALASSGRANGSPLLHKPKTPSEQKLLDTLERFRTAVPAAQEATNGALELLRKNKQEFTRMTASPTLRAYGISVENTELAVKGMKRYFDAADYLLIVQQAFSATGTDRERAVAELKVKAAQDIGTSNIVMKPLTSYIVRVLGTDAAAAFKSAAVWVSERAAVVAGTLLTSPMNDSDNRSFKDIIRDPRTSLEQRQNAIAAHWRAYEKKGHEWSEFQKAELIIYSDYVYEEATGNKGKLRTYLLPGPAK